MQFLHIKRSVISVAVLLVFLIHASEIINIPFVEKTESLLYDERIKINLQDDVDPRIVIVDIDEQSLAALGRWPWGRDVVAKIVDNLFDHYKITLLGFDVVFAEQDNSSGLSVLENLAQQEFKNIPEFQVKLADIRPRLERDSLLAKSFKDRAIVLGYSEKDSDGSTGLLPDPVLQLSDIGYRNIPFQEVNAFSANLPVLQQQASSAGFFSERHSVDRDGIRRRVPLLQSYEGALYEALSLAMVRAMLGLPPLELFISTPDEENLENHGLESISFAGFSIPVDEYANALIPFRGKAGSFPYISAVDVITKKVPVSSLEDAIVLVGTTAPGLLDLRSTPVAQVYPGVEIHANMIAGILDQNIKHKPAYTRGVEIVTLFIIFGLMIYYLPRFSPVAVVVATMALLAATVGLNLYFWTQLNVVVPLGSSLLLIAILFVIHIIYGFFLENRTKRHIAQMFGQYIPKKLVDEMVETNESFGLKGESREMSVLFSDVRGFTTISEGLEPEELTKLMNSILTPLTAVIHTHRGTIDKYMGDAIMAFWGAPIHDENHASHAVLAGMEMIEKIRLLQHDFKQRGWPEIKIGVGINTGIMNVGNMGSEFRMAYTILGDAVNLGSRLEGITKQYGVDILVGETTKQQCPGIIFVEVDRVRVKGKDQPVTIYTPVGNEADISEDVQQKIDDFHRMLDCYRRKQWDETIKILGKLKDEKFSTLYDIYYKRIQYYRDNDPGASWDGVFIHTSK